MQTCIWASGCHCHSLSLASVKSRLVYLSGTGSPGSPGQRVVKRVYVCVSQQSETDVHVVCYENNRSMYIRMTNRRRK